MLMACPCLNVIIELKNENPKKLDCSQIEIGKSDLNDVFFKQPLCIAEECNISKQYMLLVQIIDLQDWVVNRCLNCSNYCHAVGKQKHNSTILINENLIKGADKIALLKETKSYSKVFRIIINIPEEAMNNEDFGRFSLSSLPKETQTELLALQTQLTDVIQKETVQVDERIRIFSEQQYTQLEETTVKARLEYQTLKRILANGGCGPTTTLETPPKTPEALFGNRANLISHDETSRSPQHRPFFQQSSFDAEGVFDLEGDITLFNTTNGQSDVSDEEEDEPEAPRTRSIPISPMTARSLPVNVPAFSAAYSIPIDLRGNLRRRGQALPGDEIAASIKALARSIHADAASAVFGDLPKPRLSHRL